MDKPVSARAGRPKSLAKTAAILDAAEEHFMRLGYELTSMDVVAKTANVSKLTIYSHFADKDSLFKAAIQRKCQSYHLTHDFMPLADAPVHEVLRHIATNFMQLVLSPQAIAMHRIIEAESLRHQKIADLFYEAGPKSIKNAIEVLLFIGKIRKKCNFPIRGKQSNILFA